MCKTTPMSASEHNHWAPKMGMTLCKSASIWESVESATDLSDVLREAQTGDVILFQGRGVDACFIRCVALTPMWSHVGVVVVNPFNGEKYITEAYPTVIGEDPIRGGRHTGAQVTLLEYRLRTYPSGKMAWRPLFRIVDFSTPSGRQLGEKRLRRTLTAEERTDMYNKFVRFYRSLQPVPRYNMDLIDLWQYGTLGDPADDDNDGNYVCTSWAAQVLTVMGVFPSIVIPGNVFLPAFGGEGPLPLKGGWDYGAVHFFKGPAEKQ